jgi:hypothetical protein
MNSTNTRHMMSALVALGALCGAAEARADEAPQPRTYAVIVANNGSVDEGVAPLRYADDDGARYYELFSAFADEVQLLTVLDADSQPLFPQITPLTKPPTRAQLARTIRALKGKIAADRERGLEREVYLIFTGHGNINKGNEGYLSLADGKLTRAELYRDVLGELDGATYRHVLIDACHAYFMVQSRGGKDGWQDDRSGDAPRGEFAAYLSRRGKPSGPQELSSTTGAILSTAGTAEVHEWSKFRAGVFSHELRSGLLGAADVDGDRRITYGELEAYLAAANEGVTNPKARLNVWLKAPSQDRRRPLMDLRRLRGATELELPAGRAGRYHVEDARGLRYADLNTDGRSGARLWLLRGPVGGRAYYLRTDDEQAEVSVSEAMVPSGALAFAAMPAQSRGSVEESFRTSLFATPFGPGFYAGYMAGRERADEATGAQLMTASTRSSWDAQLWVGYAPGAGARGEGGVQHSLDVSLVMEHIGGLGVGPYVAYGFTDGGVGSVHRISVGAEGWWSALVGDGWWAGPRLRLGQQAMIQSGSQTSADPFGLRAEAAALAGWELTPTLSVALQAGVGLDVTNGLEQTSGELRNEQRVYATPFVGVGLRF